MVQEILIFAAIFACFLMAVKYCKPTPDADAGSRAAVQNISVEKGVVLIFRVATTVSTERAAEIVGHFERCFSGFDVKVLILSEEVELVGSIQLGQDHNACQRNRGNDSPFSEPEINAGPH